MSGERIQVVHMLPGYTHHIINLSDTEDLVTLMWANEILDPSHPDAFLSLYRLQVDAFCVVSDSGTLPEESSFYLSVGHPIPAVCIRTSTERPEALDKGRLVLSGIDGVGLPQSVDLAVEMVRNGDLGVPVPDYVDENVSDKVVRIVQSYVGVVNKMVWRKG